MSLQREGTNVSLVVIRIGKTYQELNAVVRGQRCRYAVLVRKHFFVVTELRYELSYV